MGVTIHYSGRAKDRAAVDKIMMTVMAAGSEWDWPVAQIEDPDGEIMRMTREPGGHGGSADDGEPPGITIVSTDEQPDGGELYEGPVRILVTQPGEGCEPLRLMFDREHRMDGFTKTQYGPVEAHIRICRILRAIERHFEVLEVYDESGYWESEDREALEERIGALSDTEEAVIARLEAAKRKKELDDMYKIDGDEPGDP